MKKLFTKNIIFGLGFIFIGSIASAQNGLEGIIVEKYYVSNAADSIASAAASAGSLNVGATTYRIFADMLPGYNFEMAYGNANHSLKINTTTSFYNNIDRGSTNPSYSKVNAAKNTVMLDSWLSVGAACAGNFGILKSEDNGVANIVNADGILTNADTAAGIPLTVQDGIISVTGKTPGTFGTVGDADSAIAVFDASSLIGNSFTIKNGAWYVAGGATGPDSATNKVLIAQLTTAGILSFELNLQIGTPTGGVQLYVAKKPVFNTSYGVMEDSIPGLSYTSPSAPSSINSIENRNDIISIFPNPSTGMYTLNIKSDKFNSVNSNYYKIYDLTGNVLYNKRIENSTMDYSERIDLSSYTNGIYFTEISIDGLRKMIKLIKE